MRQFGDLSAALDQSLAACVKWADRAVAGYVPESEARSAARGVDFRAYAHCLPPPCLSRYQRECRQYRPGDPRLDWMDDMTATDSSITTQADQTASGFWFARRLWPYLRVWILGLLPCPDLADRYRMRRTARSLVTLRTWPGMDATSAQAAHLVMLRLLWLQRQTRRAVRGRHREASIMLARACVETLLLGLYCLREPKAITQLHAANVKALGDAFAYFESIDIAPAEVIRQCAANFGQPGPAPKVWHMAKTVDNANGNTAARDIYHRLYAPLSNFTVHASGLALMRHVRGDDRLSPRPSRTWNRRSPARVADAATGLLAAALAQEAGEPTAKLLRYTERHFERALMPVAVMGLAGLSASKGKRKNLPHRMIKTAQLARELYDYLWHGRAAVDAPASRVAFVREHFAAILNADALDVPAGTLDPFIDYVADKLVRATFEGSPAAPAPDSPASS